MTLDTAQRHIPWIRIALCILALSGPFFFPWHITGILTIIAALFVPPVAFVVGVLFDALYWGGLGIPVYTIFGLIVAIAAYFVHQFLKTRIIS